MKTLKEAKKNVGGLSNPSKMPGYGYGLSAFDCITGSKLRLIKNSTCSMCYALKGRYTFKGVKNAHANRTEAITKSDWVDDMVLLVNNYGKKIPYFRWHDSGDLQSLAHLKKIVAVAMATPAVKHWLPTREAGILKAFYKEGNSLPGNLAIRVSATMIDGKPHSNVGLTSTVSKDKKPIGHNCPASKQGNECKSCRACWNINIPNVNYAIH
jgi:hypothetical protein|tara:strand:+ start:135 stop:767 length:633 start_codon:yes stop_codon:yes gene_type:complete